MCRVQCIGLWRALAGDTSWCCLPSVHLAKNALHLNGDFYTCDVMFVVSYNGLL